MSLFQNPALALFSFLQCASRSSHMLRGSYFTLYFARPRCMANVCAGRWVIVVSSHMWYRFHGPIYGMSEALPAYVIWEAQPYFSGFSETVQNALLPHTIFPDDPEWP